MKPLFAMKHNFHRLSAMYNISFVSKQISLQDTLKTSLRHALRTSGRLPLQRTIFFSSKTSSRYIAKKPARLPQDIFNPIQDGLFRDC